MRWTDPFGVYLAAPRLLVLSHRHNPLPGGCPVQWCERVQDGLAYLRQQQAQGRKGADLVILDASLPPQQALALLHSLRREWGLAVMLRRTPR